MGALIGGELESDIPGKGDSGTGGTPEGVAESRWLLIISISLSGATAITFSYQITA
jgi:hypothetical protein